MDSTLLIRLACLAMLLVAGLTFAYQIYQLVKFDAKARGLERPKLWGAFAASGQGSGGLLLYFMYRRRHPRRDLAKAEAQAEARSKKIASLCLLPITIAGVVAIITLFY